MLKAGDTVVAGNHLMDFTSAPLTIGNKYIIQEVIPPAWVGGMELLVIEKTDNGRQGTFDRARFRKVQ